MKLTPQDMPPKPKWLGNFNVPHSRDTHGGVTVDYWGTDEEVLKQLTPEEITEINAQPGKSGALFHATTGTLRVVFHCNVEDPQGQYMLWEITGDFQDIFRDRTSPGACYYMLTVTVIVRIAHEILGVNITLPGLERN